MAQIFKFQAILAILAIFSCFIYPGHAQCTLSNISVTQKPTGNLFGGKPEYEVTIKNVCPCQQSNVQFNINGFQTAEPVDPSILDKDGFVNDRLPLPYDGVTFKYSSGSLFPFKPISSQVSCS